MKFTFKRKYTLSFFVFLTLTILAIAFYFIGPKFIDRNSDFFLNALVISLIDITLITIFILGLYRVNYYLYHNRLEIHRSLHKTITLDYNNIKEMIEYPNDTVIFMFGKRPSFKIKYQKGNKIKNYRVRVSSHQLLKLVIENEKKIHLTTNK